MKIEIFNEGNTDLTDYQLNVIIGAIRQVKADYEELI
jgi:hypothetical protein